MLFQRKKCFIAEVDVRDLGNTKRILNSFGISKLATPLPYRGRVRVSGYVHSQVELDRARKQLEKAFSA